MTHVPTGPSSLAQRVQLLIPRVEYKPATTVEEREAIFRLRYDAYLREEAISPRAVPRLADEFDDLANGCIIGAYIDGILAASIRIHVLSSSMSRSPAMDTFSDALQPLLQEGKTIIDPNRFVTNHEQARRFLELAYLVLRVPFFAGKYFGADVVTATVRREHEAFYVRVMRCRRIVEPRSYPTLIKPLGLMTVDYPCESRNVLARYPFFQALSGEAERLFESIDVNPV